MAITLDLTALNMVLSDQVKHSLLSAQDAAYERLTNPELLSLTENGDYLFVENHFVYNAPLYVKTSEDGQLELTDYALAHIDECCLVFDLKIKNNLDEDYQTVCFLNRDEGDVTFEYKCKCQNKYVSFRQVENVIF